jgi:hypothetical protein
MGGYQGGLKMSLKISFVAMTLSLLSFVFLSSAEMTGMSLQERMRQSDAVVIGEVLDAQKTSIEKDGTEYWLATCQVERYLIGPKMYDIYNPSVGEAKGLSVINIMFMQKMQKPAPAKLLEGKKYLLFLKGPAVPRDNRDKGNVYEMITPYHGAFEAGQDYFVHDERDPQYPQAVKLSFEEIVRRLTPQDTAIDIRQQLYYAEEYWYGQMRDKMASEAVRMTSPPLPKLHEEGEWTVWDFVHHHGSTTHRVLTRFLNAEEAKIRAIEMVLDDIKSSLRSSIHQEREEGIRQIEILTGLNLKNNACVSPERCLKWIESNEDYFVWDEQKNVLGIAEQDKMANFGRGVRGLALSIQTDKISHNAPSKRVA